ncbi:porin [Vibrio metschnikovii]|nr:porin [Vibrio metschnikovii]EKO3719461.1 porin [Vibrio metschnikovii]EKO3724614.1 porin [Vibrio metschnikovii]EKO3735814.1 porin [Vibrio metschnikovii]EKO3745840.1 porin [Vibrio metschnikovii]
MKKTLVALLVASAATSVNAAEIYKSDTGSVNFYGQLRTQITFEKDKDATLDAGSSRAGVNAKYSLYPDLDILGKVEFRISNQAGVEDTKWDVRQHYIGFASDMGTFTFGKQIVVADDVYGAEYSYAFGGEGLYPMGAFNSSMIKYELERDAFWLKASYSLPETDSKNPNQELSELFFGTSYKNLSLHAGLGQWEETSGVDINFYEATAEYTFGKTLVGFTYYHIDADVDKNNFNFAGTHQLTDTIKPYAGYEMIKPKSGNDIDNVYLGVEFKPATWFRTYAEYAYYKEQTKDSVSKFAIGARVYW